MEVINDTYEHCINVLKNGKYSLKIRYFASNLGVWSKLSNAVRINIFKISEEHIAFNIFDSHFISVLDDGMISGNGSKKGKHARMVCADKGFDAGIHEWTMQCVEYDNAVNYGNASHAIGILTTPLIAKQGSHWVNDTEIKYAYYWNSHRRTIYGSIGGEYIYENNVNDGWKEGDVIRILLDCIRWTIQFSKNDKIINSEPYKVKPNQMYYPLIVMRSHNDKYKCIAYE